MVEAKIPLVLGLSLAGILIGAFSFGLGGDQGQAKAKVTPKVQVAPAGSEELVVGGGCFWCLETLYEDLKGVYFVESGYAGGRRPNVTYDEVCSGTTGHAEVVKIVFDPKQISADDMLRLFFVTHDPTTLNQQGPDRGTQYRSVVFFSDDAEKERALRIRDEVAKAKIWRNPIVTTLEPLINYTRAEEYHQDYFAKFEKASPVERMSMNAGYCSAIIAPKVVKFRKQYAEKLKRKGED